MRKSYQSSKRVGNHRKGKRQQRHGAKERKKKREFLFLSKKREKGGLKIIKVILEVRLTFVAIFALLAILKTIPIHQQNNN